MDTEAAARRWVDGWSRAWPAKDAELVVSDGDRAAVEWWAIVTTHDEGDVTIAGTSVLRFTSDGSVQEQRDTWSQRDGTVEPPPGWGR